MQNSPDLEVTGEEELTMDSQCRRLNLDDNTQSSPPSGENKALRMMKLMGYKSGSGLGKNEQGISIPVQIPIQIGKKGLGSSFQCTNEQWDFTQEDVQVQEKAEWLQNEGSFQFIYENMCEWPKEGKPLISVENESNFCTKQILLDTLRAKDIFEELGVDEVTHARRRANPFETIYSVFFINRAALKMANIDAATDFMFTNLDANPHHCNNSHPYYFADVCAGPGGFTEYILWRKKWQFKGFGMTLRDAEHDFNLDKSKCISPVTFHAHYGAQGDGNVCSPENIDDFKEKVIHETEGKGVHFMMSDGGFSVKGDENMQEVLSKNIYICQCLVALSILRPHGHFVTKLFDVFTCFSVGLLFLMYQCFEEVCILKPNSSRPANSERYFICKDFKDTSVVNDIRRYIRVLVDRLWELKDDKENDVIEIVPLSVIENDKRFYSYIFDSNNRLAKSQTVHLRKLGAFCRNPSLVDTRQDSLRKSCLQYWKISDKPKPKLIAEMTAEKLLSDVLGGSTSAEILHMYLPYKITMRTRNLDEILEDLCDWQYAPMQGTGQKVTSNLYAGVDETKCCRWQSNQWMRVKNLQLARGTLLYGEMVKEYIVGTDGDQPRIKSTLHVIDALRLGDLNLSKFTFEKRLEYIRKYCKAVNREFHHSSHRIRAKFLDKLETLSVRPCFSKDENDEIYVMELPVMGYKAKREYFNVNSVLLLKVNESQNFCSTYLSRMQLSIGGWNENEEEKSSLKDFVEFLEKRRFC